MPYDNHMQQVATRLMDTGTPLAQSISTPIATGPDIPLAAAWVLDQATRKEIVIFDPTCAPLIKPLLHSEHLRHWYAEHAGMWLLEIPAGWTAATFGENLREEEAWTHLAARHPSVARHLAPFAETLRQQHNPGMYWWELPPYAHYDALATPKICWPASATSPCWVWDTAASRLDAGSLFLPDATPYLLGVLASQAVWVVLAQLQEVATTTTRNLSAEIVAQAPIPTATADEQAAVGDLALRMSAQARERHTLEREGRERILKNFAPPGTRLNATLQRWWDIDFQTLRTEIVNTLDSDIPLRYHDEWEDWLVAQHQRYDQQTAAIVQTEAELNTLVARLFHLNDAEMAWLSQ